MIFSQARGLHNSDEVILKATKEVGYVVRAWEENVGNRKVVAVEAVFPQSGFQQVAHREIS